MHEESASQKNAPLDVTSYLFKGWVWVAATIATISAFLHLRIGLNNDTMTLLHQTKKMLAGGTPYVDYIDVNPPLVYMIFSLPALLASATGAPMHIALNSFAVIVATLSLVLCAAILRSGEVRRGMRGFILASIAVALLFVSFMHQLFADREWLLMTLITPLLLLYSPLVERAHVGLPVRSVTAIMAALGFALKPYALPLYFMALAYRLICESPTPKLTKEAEHYIIGALGIIYLAIVFIFFREYVFTFMPIASQTYGVIGWDWNSKLSIIQNQLFGKYGLIALVATFLLVMLTPSYYDRVITYLGFVLLGTVASYGLSAGWYYTQYPFMVIALLMAIAAGSRLIVACSVLAHSAARRFTLLFVCGGLFAGGWNYYANPALSQLSWDRKMMKETGHTINASVMYPPAWAQVEKHLEARPRFLLIGINLWAPSFLEEGGKSESVGRFDYLWPLPGIVMLQQSAQGQSEFKKLSKWFSETMAEDIERHTPDMVINDISPHQRSLPLSYDALPLLQKNERFAKAWEDYVLERMVNECSSAVKANCAYEIYYRK